MSSAVRDTVGTLAHSLFETCSPAAQQLLGRLKSAVLLPRSLSLRRIDFETEGCRGTYIGEGQSFDALRKLYQASFQPAAPVSLGRLPGAIREAMAGRDIVITEVNRLVCAFLPPGGWEISPWIRQVTDLAGSRFADRRRAIEATWGRKVRQQHYQYRISHSHDDVAAFFRDYYAPWLRSRHGEDASIRGLWELRLAMRRGFLLQVFDGGDWIAGAVVVRRGASQIDPFASGLLPSRSDCFRRGALSAVYYFAFLWAREHGIRYVGFGGSRPHLDDGLFHHKWLWGAEPELDPWHHTALHFWARPRVNLPEAVRRQLVVAKGGFETIGSLNQMSP
jgi:hypothetical protein